MSEEQSTRSWVDDPDVMLDRPDATGINRVDAVIETISAIGAVPLERHVGVYEQAHVELRAALDDRTPASAG